MKLNFNTGLVDLTHGSGGRATMDLIEQLFLPAFSNPFLNRHNDQACLQIPSTRMAMSTDSYVVSPLFFPGGDIGCLAVHGTINDIAMSGAKPLYLSVGFIIEEGFPLFDLKKIVDSMAKAARESNVLVVTGDTKVVEKGKADGVFINTTGIGVVPEGIEISGDMAKPGDKILLNGSIGDHGIAILSKRENLNFSCEIESDTASLSGLVQNLLQTNASIHVLRDPTRGGLAATLNEIAHQSQVGMVIYEDAIVVQEPVRSACEFLGLDPLNIANEGKLICICKKEDAKILLSCMQSHPLGKKAAIVGEVVEQPCLVRLQTILGTHHIVPWISGEQLPRIC